MLHSYHITRESMFFDDYFVSLGSWTIEWTEEKMQIDGQSIHDCNFWRKCSNNSCHWLLWRDVSKGCRKRSCEMRIDSFWSPRIQDFVDVSSNRLGFEPQGLSTQIEAVFFSCEEHLSHWKSVWWKSLKETNLPASVLTLWAQLCSLFWGKEKSCRKEDRGSSLSSFFAKSMESIGRCHESDFSSRTSLGDTFTSLPSMMLWFRFVFISPTADDVDDESPKSNQDCLTDLWFWFGCFCLSRNLKETGIEKERISVKTPPFNPHSLLDSGLSCCISC